MLVLEFHRDLQQHHHVGDGTELIQSQKDRPPQLIISAHYKNGDPPILNKNFPIKDENLLSRSQVMRIC